MGVLSLLTGILHFDAVGLLDDEVEAYSVVKAYELLKACRVVKPMSNKEFSVDWVKLYGLIT